MEPSGCWRRLALFGRWSMERAASPSLKAYSRVGYRAVLSVPDGVSSTHIRVSSSIRVARRYSLVLLVSEHAHYSGSTRMDEDTLTHE